MTEWLDAPVVARMLGIRTSSLARMRFGGRGPEGWRYRSKTAVIYPRSEVERWLEERHEAAESRRGVRPAGFGASPDA